MTTTLKEWLILNEYSLDDLNSVGKYGNSALMKACREANIQIVDELLALGVDLNIKNVDGNSALWNACFGNSYECFEALVKAGIDIDSQNVNNVLKYKARTDFESLDGFKAIDLSVTSKIVKLLKNATLS